MRPERLLTMAATLIAAALVAASAAATTSQPMLMQDSEDSAPDVATVATLSLGQRFAGPGWDLEVQDVFVVDSPDRADWSEVRTAVALRSTGAQIPYLWAGLAGETGYPTLGIRDAAGELHAIPLTDPQSHARPGSALLAIRPGLPAAWTIGFEVPTAFADQLYIEAEWDGQTLASWDLQSTPVALSSWDMAPRTVATELNEPIPWSDDLEVTVVDHAVLACGAPDTEQVTTSYALIVDVTNTGVDDAPFPNVQHPRSAGFAIWHDGASARYSTQTHIFDIDATDTSDPLRAETHERVMIPPETTYQRALVFNVPRDSRFNDVDELAASVILNPPAGEPAWLDLRSTGASDVAGFVDCGDVVGGLPFDIDQDGEVTQPVTVTEGDDPANP